MQSAGCQLTSSRDVSNFVVTSNDENSAAYCRRRCPHTSPLSTSHSPLMYPPVVTKQSASCHANQKSITAFTTAHDLSLS